MKHRPTLTWCLQVFFSAEALKLRAAHAYDDTLRTCEIERQAERRWPRRGRAVPLDASASEAGAQRRRGGGSCGSRILQKADWFFKDTAVVIFQLFFHGRADARSSRSAAGAGNEGTGHAQLCELGSFSEVGCSGMSRRSSQGCSGGLYHHRRSAVGHSVKIEPAGSRSAVGLVRRAVLIGAMKLRSRRGPTGRFYPSDHAEHRAGFNHVAVQV